MSKITEQEILKPTLYHCPYCHVRTSNQVTEIACIKVGTNMNNLYFRLFYMLDCETCGNHYIVLEEEKPTNENKNPNLSSINKDKDKNWTVLSQKYLYPIVHIDPEIPNASPNMPEDVKSLYDEAASVFELSPRSSAALIRLTLETLLKKHLVNDGKKHSLNEMIGMSNTHQPAIVTEFMDMIRKSGNEEVHPNYEKLEHEWGNITKDTNKDEVLYLFKYINSICDLLGVWNKLDNDYEALPSSQKKAIQNRNKKYNN